MTFGEQRGWRDRFGKGSTRRLRDCLEAVGRVSVRRSKLQKGAELMGDVGDRLRRMNAAARDQWQRRVRQSPGMREGERDSERGKDRERRQERVIWENLMLHQN